MSPSLIEERVQTSLERLYLRQMVIEVDRLCSEASQAEWSYLEFLDRLLEAEINARWERNITLKKRWAHLPFHKTMADFDFSFQPSLDRKQVNELFTLRFVTSAENVLLLGPPGVGKPTSIHYPFSDHGTPR